MSIRQNLRRTVLFGLDAALCQADNAYVRLAGWRIRRETGRHIDRRSGRTSVAHLRQDSGRDRIWAMIEGAIERGADPDDLARQVAKLNAEHGETLAEQLRQRAPQMLREHRSSERGMQRRMRAVYGPAFDGLYELYVCIEEIGSDAGRRIVEQDALVSALLGLHARVCLGLLEVHALLKQGFPHGALARTRSLHELAVVMAVLAEHGRETATADLAERFLRHAAVDELRDLVQAERDGFEIDRERLDAVQRERDSLVAAYGDAFLQDLAWARPLFPGLPAKRRVRFDELERLARTGLERFDYRHAGHHLHASAWGGELNLVERAGIVYRTTGPTNLGLTQAAAVAMDTALAAVTALIWGVDELPDPMGLVGLHALHVLAARALDLFEEGEALVAAREARLSSP